MCDIGSGELPTLYSESKPKARKEHTCCECGSTVSPGENYEKITGLWDNFQTYKTCLFCAEIRQKMYSKLDLYYDEAIVFGGLWECVGYDFN